MNQTDEHIRLMHQYIAEAQDALERLREHIIAHTEEPEHLDFAADVLEI